MVHTFNPSTEAEAATRESAFVHAIASAGVAFAVTRSCAEGSAAICGCSSRLQGSPAKTQVTIRKAIASHMHLKCKCHGLSGSCEVKTCWWSQPDFRTVGDFLKDKYDSASEMVVEKHQRDLVYYEASPNFCEPNPETGSFGTRDRTCNVISDFGHTEVIN
ncbi:proto-oncogene Wnt-3-like protein [Cricetulus griseus]|nr:proto-oncogene Wnt-3-like protein [Cricetulus griseus]